MTNSSQVEYDSIILDCTKELKKFRGVVCELDMPQIDVDLFLGHVLPAITNERYFSHRLSKVAHVCAQGEGIYEGLFENSEEEVPNHVFMRVHDAVVQFGVAMQNKLQDYHAYRNGIFAYELKEYVNDATVVFGKKNLSLP